MTNDDGDCTDDEDITSVAVGDDDCDDDDGFDGDGDADDDDDGDGGDGDGDGDGHWVFSLQETFNSELLRGVMFRLTVASKEVLIVTGCCF